MKRFFILLLCAVTLLSIMPQALAADEPDPIPVIAKEDLSPTPTGIHHYMLICVDSWAADLSRSGNHTDGLILVTVDEIARRVMLTSFIRDMLIQRPDGKYGRINNIMDLMSPKVKNGIDGQQGIRMLVDTINSHFDLRIDDFIVVDFKQVENIINAVGGVDISITSREATYLKNYSISSASTTPSITAGRGGVYHFSGHAAVIYMRIRKIETEAYVHADGTLHTDNQDYGRTYRDRKVLTAIADSLKDITYENALKLLDVILSNIVYTNMTTDDMMDALDLAMQMRGIPVETIRMPIDNPAQIKTRADYSYEEFPYAGMATKQINVLKNRQALHDFLMDSFVVVDDE